MNLFHTLLRPDREELEMADRMIVVSAANLLEVGEFQVLQLAYKEWFGKDLSPALVDRLFHSYMLHNEVPHWARHYARLILIREARGALDVRDTAYHVYDHDYRTHAPKGVQHFLVATGVLAFCLISLIIIAESSVRTPMTRLPPYFDREELRAPNRNQVERTDGVPVEERR
jgi:hypothetical protein